MAKPEMWDPVSTPAKTNPVKLSKIYFKSILNG